MIGRLAAMDFISRAVEAVAAWREPVPDHPALAPDPARFEAAWAEFTERMAGNHPFHHPRYAGQMLKPPHPVAIAAYTAAMHVNANNHALDGGPATSAMELEVMAWLTEMFGFPDESLGHLTSSGTIANLEALWIARELHPGQGRRARGQRALHARAHVRRARDRVVRGAVRRRRPDRHGRRREAVRDRRHRAWSSSPRARPATGTVDDIARAVALRERFGVRVHVDAAYGGFFTLLAREGLVSDVIPRDRRRRQRRRRPAQARAAAVRVRRGAVPRPGRRPALQARLAVHLLHLRRTCTWARSASSARAPAPRRPRCG